MTGTLLNRREIDTAYDWDFIKQMLLTAYDWDCIKQMLDRHSIWLELY